MSGSENDSTPGMWRCIHSDCNEGIPPTPEGKAPKFCMFCGGSQSRCIHPDCKEPLFSAKAKLCHECSRSQQAGETNSGSPVAASSDSGKSDGGAHDLNEVNSEMDNGNVTTDDKNKDDATKSKNTEPTSPDKPSGQIESSVDSEKGVQESQATQLPPDTNPPSNASESSSVPPAVSSKPPALEKDSHTQVVNQQKTPTPPPESTASQASAAGSKGQTSGDKRPPSHVASDSDASSDHEQFHTPPPSPDVGKPHTEQHLDESKPADDGQQQPPKGTSDKPTDSSVSVSLKRLSLEENAGRKHSLDREESEEPKPAKRKALDDGKPPVAADTGKAGGGAQITESKHGEDKHQDKEDEEQKAKKSDEQEKKQDGANGTEVDHPLKEPIPYKKQTYQEAQEQSLVKEEDGKKSKKKKPKKEEDKSTKGKGGAAGTSKRQTRSQTAAGVKEIDVTGFHPPPERALEFTFHVLLPLEAWNWGKKSHMCMQFNHPKLGEWQRDIGEFRQIRDVGDGLYEMEGKVMIDSNLLKNQAPLHYKYLVHSPQRSEESVSPYEFLHGAPAPYWGQKVVDRKIFIPTSKFATKGLYHHYDSMAYPESKSKNILLRAWDSIVGQSSKDVLAVPEHSSMQAKALEVYLEKYYDKLTKCELSPSFNIIQATREITQIFLHLYTQLVSSRDNAWIANKLDEVMATWLLIVTEHLRQINIASAEDNGRKMASALTVIFCFYQLIPRPLKMELIPFTYIEMLLSCLYLLPDLEHAVCLDLDFIRSLVPGDNRKAVSEAIVGFCLQLSHTKLLESPQWLDAIPLVHLLRGDLRPFQKLSSDPKKMGWNDKSLGLVHVRKSTNDKHYGIVERVFDHLQPLTVLDPSLLTELVYICPKFELPFLFLQIPTFVSIAWLASTTKNSKDLSRSEVEDLTKLVEDVVTVQPHEEMREYQELTSAIHSSCWLFQEIIKKLIDLSKDTYHLRAMKAVVSLVLSAVSRLKAFSADGADLKKALDEEINQAVDNLYPELEKWVKRKLSDRSFGGSGIIFYEHSSKMELKVWNSLVQVDCPNKEILALWHTNVVQRMIKERVSQVKYDKRIDLFGILESQDTHDLITNVFLECVMGSIEEMTLKDTMDSVNRLYNSNSSQKKEVVGKILETLLTKQYPKDVSISFGQLLKWDLWPTLILVFKSEPMIKIDGKNQARSCLPERSEMMCTFAVSTLEAVCRNICSGDITVRDLQMIIERKDHMEKLCSALKSRNLEKRGKEYDSMKAAIEARINEYTVFMNRKNLLGSLCRGITVEVAGLQDLRDELDQNLDTARLNSLCVSDGASKMTFKLFKSAIPLDPIKIMYDFISRHHQNDLFHRIWERTSLRAARDIPNLTIQDIVTKIWDPAFKECCRILDSLQDNSMKLREVDDRFSGYDDPNVIQNHLYKLFKGVELCCIRKPPQICPPWIKSAVQRMQEYWTLSRYAKAAQTVLDLRARLGLTGEFSLMETIASQMSSTMKDKPLEAIDASLIEAGDFLREVEGDRRKLHCLEIFADSLEVVEWIRNETKGIDDLHNFVSVALHTTAGESDFDSDRLSNLKKVGNGFRPLIFDLMRNKSFSSFRRGCLTVWEALEAAPDLPEKLRGCKSELAWYKSVKETQGSIEETTFGQMNNILAYGCYHIGSRRAVRNFDSIDDIIHLMLTEHDKPLTKKQYILNELRDLESKLALIVGKNAENKTQVGVFTHTLHNVCRIAEVLISLQRVGNVKYTGWRLQVPCGLSTVVPMLQDQAKKMEHELTSWEEEVTQKRGDFYELNYYTTLQLLSLRRELGVMKSKPNTGPAAVTPNVLALLESISTQVTAPHVHTIVQNVISEGIRTVTSAPSISTQGGASIVSPSLSSPAVLGGPSSSGVSTSPRGQPSLALELFSSAEVQTSSGAEDMKVDVELPKISEGDLSQEQKGMMQDLINHFDFPNQLVLKAFEECKENAPKYEIQNWCNDNFEKYAHFVGKAQEGDFSDDDNEDKESDMSSMESEDEGYSYQQQATPLSVSASTPKDLTSPSTPRPMGHSGIRQIEAQPQLPIDRNHPVVQQLRSAGFTEEQCMDAVERYETLDRAMDYLMSVELGEEGEGMFQTAALIRQDSTSLWRQSSGGARYVEPLDPQYSDSEPTIQCDPNAEKSYLSLEELGNVLTGLTPILQSGVPIQRSFILNPGHPNLIVTPPDNVLRTVLALFMKDEALPLPSLEEVLICNPTTTAEEVTLLWQRAIGDPEFKRIFCLVHAERLTYQVSDKALRSLSHLSQGKRDYRLVIICSNEEEEKSHIISKLHSCRRPFAQTLDVGQCQRYLKAHFTGQVESLSFPSLSQLQPAMASAVDHEQSCVRLVTSLRSGMGKSLFIQRMVEQLQMNMRSAGKSCVTVPLHGPKVTPDVVMGYLEKYMQESACTIFHLDIAPTILSEVDTILFSLLILCGLTDSQGRVWRCHPGQLYAVELTLPEKQEQTAQVGQTVALTNLLPTVHCVSPREAIERMGDDDPSVIVMDEQVFARPICQRVYQYLRRHMGNFNLDSFSYAGNVEGTKKNCLEIFLHNCGIRDPSWCEIRHFINFLDVQLQSCEESVFCDEMLVGDVMSGLKSFVVKFMIRMSRDFATSSLQGEVARENLEDVEMDGEEEDNLEQYQIAIRRRWERNSHPYIFFNQDRMSITFVGFMVTRNGDLVDPAHRGVLEQAIMTPQLYTGLKQNKVDFDDDYRQWQKSTMIEKIAIVMGIEFPYDPDETYVLTVDNLIKILAIQMRFRCGIPVVIMGETGCGKTRLIRYMCDLARQGEEKRNMLIMKVHGGTTEEDIEKFIKKAEKEAEQNRVKNMDTVVFFDEANTTDAIGLIKEIMCDRRLHGKSVSEDLKFIAACNPYRKHSEDMIKKLESAGLGFYVRETETHQKLGKIPLRQLVYRVLDLPPSMRPLVYDFGQLQQVTEDDYIRQIVHDHVTVHPGLSQESPHYISAVARVLAWSQAYMRGRKDECSFVSLRDVERAMIVFKYFYEKMDVFAPLIDQKQREEEEDEDSYDEESDGEEMLLGVVRPLPQAIGKITRALILSLSVCYHARLQDRDDYEEGVSGQFANPLSLPGGDERFRDEIRWCQEVLLDNMRLGENIAKNAALRENVFMMAICIELRIPLFIVGKPGSSKSLAKAVIHASMRGKSSSSNLLKDFKEMDMFSYQCSQLSTPESVIEVFNTAKRFQSKQDTKSYVAVVVLDEVGLAEDSPNLPLKALHPLLEDGTEGAGAEGKNDVIVAREERVAFIGISNWALDPAKMNRGVMVTRGDPSEDELKYSAEGICSNKEDDPVKARLKQYFKPLSEAYMEICDEQEREFFGLRDFYSLIKMLYWMCEKSGNPPTWPQLEHAIKRNFGGLESTELDPVKIFMDKLPCRREPPDLSSIPEELHSIISPDCTRFGLIRASLSSKERTWHGENRYLLFLTENYAALDILKHYLSGVDSSQTLNTADVKQETMEPFVLFGSSFPKDQEYTQVCRNINQIKICMETGRTVILLNLDNLYESLYDVLNQYYIYNGGNRYVDLGLQTHRVRCRVHDDFKLILIAEKKKVYDKFATPLINRLEKHFVLTSSVLEDWQADLLTKFEAWISKFCETRGKKFARGDAFIGYQKDTPAAVVFQASNFLRRLREENDDNVIRSKLEVLNRAGILDNMPLNVLFDREEVTEQWKDAVLPLSQFLLLQTAAPDAVVRLQNTALEEQKAIEEMYFKKLHHHSIEEFLTDQLQQCEGKGGLLIQVTTHSHLLAYDELEQIRRAIEMRVESCSLHEFETELDFTSKIGPYFKRGEEDESSVLVIIQCDSGHSNGDLIACARNRIYDVRSEKEGDTHVVFVIHLPHQAANSSFVGFQGDPWISVHIDDLRPTSDSTIMPYEAMGTAISQLFLGDIIPDDQFGVPMDQQGGEANANDEGASSDIEMDSKPSRPSRREDDSEGTQVLPSEMEGEGESMDEDELPPNEENGEQMSEGSGAEDVEEERMEEEAAGVERPQPMTLPPPQCQRLHGCIQAAASKLQDDNKRRATQRVEILVNLVPKDIPLPLDLTTFHGILVQHVFNVLKQRDRIWEADKQWVLNEAMDARKLQNGGTFRNVLARKIDDVVVPIFSEIIAYMDRNYNLDLINPRSENTPLCQFWLNMFGRQKIMQFNYVEMMTPREKVPGVGGRRSAEDFKCQLPFSWIIKEAVDAQWDNAKSSAGNNRETLHKQLCEAIHQMEVGEVLTSVQDEYSEDFYKHYLHDFVRNVHKSQNKKQEQADTEYNLIEMALDEMVHDDDFGSIDGHDTLIRRIAALHVVYMFNKSQVMWFGQLVSQKPGIMLALKDKHSPDTSEMVLHLFAVEKALDDLKPPMEANKVAEHLLPWLNDLRLSQNAIDTILSLPPRNTMLENARLKWQLIRAMQMFLEHVLLKHSEVPVTYARRLELFLMSGSDFLKATALERVKKHLNQIHIQLKPKYRSKTVSSIQKSCREFFMEVVSNLCFSGHKPPEPELIKMLMNTVFTEKKQDASLGTRDMTPYQVDPDQVPVVRSFLLQLLLEHNSEQVKDHLKDYFDRSHQVFGREADQGLCLLCIQCFEDALYKEFYEKCFARRVEDTIEILEEGHQALCRHGQYTDIVTLEYLEGVAKIRFALSVVAELLNQSDQPRSQEDGVLVVHLLHQAREICVDPNINSIDDTGQRDTVGPVVFLIKLLVRQYGLTCLQSASEAHAWIVPEQLKKTGEEEKIIDPFVIYNDVGYNHTRLAVSNAAYGKQLPRLVEATTNLNIKETVPLLMALYQKITLSHASTQASKQILPDVLGDFNKFILECKALPREMQWMARSLIVNEQGGPFPLLSVTPHQRPQCRTLTALVVHTAAVFFSRQKLEVLWPFLHMLTDPAKLANAYLPTMGEDHLQEARRALGGAFYACPRGHPYFVGECGQPMQELTCLTCGARIGGINHKLRADNTGARLHDATQTGHDLGDPNGRTAVPAPERNLSPPAICVLRALMHSAFLWACCNNDQRVGDIVQLVKPHVPVQGLAEFFWRHLDKDIELLGRAVGKGYEEAAMIVHLCLGEILVRDPPGTATVGVTKTLAARNAREQWETIFNKHYVQPVLGSLEQKVGLAMQTILSDDDQEHDQLFFLVYERTELMNQTSIQPHLWTYHSRITLEHLAQTLQEKKMKERHPILYGFLQAEPVLRATQYLPDIVRLQQCLYDAFHHRLDKKDAVTQTVGEFLDKLTSENARNEYQERIGSLQKAWALVGHMLKNHARLRVEEKYLIPAITLDTTLEYLIPTTTEAGACTTALVDFLVLSHNDFIEKCRATVSKDDMSTAFWREHKVPITHIHRCHLVDYEHQLLSIVLSHCNYSLTFGKGQSIKYNHQALEKHILDRFIHGKPRILSDIPHVVYRKDIYTTVTFAAVRKKVKNQEQLNSRVKQEILSELRTPDRLREALDVVEIVLGFLSSGGGKAEKPLGEYIDRMLKMKRRPFSSKAREYCCLGHILSLWETISVELARQLYLRGQEPFDSVRDEFLKPLEENEAGVLEKCLRLFDLDSLLGTLYEFIETHVKHSPDGELEWPVKDTLEEFLDRNDLPHIPSFYEIFPDDITLNKAIAAWKCIVDYQKKVKQN